MESILRPLAAISLLLLIAYACSMDRRAIRPRVVLAALALQCLIGAAVLFLPVGRTVLLATADIVSKVLSYGHRGTEFVFGGLVGPKMAELFGPGGFVFALQVLPSMVYLTALISVLYYLGVMRWVVLIVGTLFQRLLGVSRVEALAAVTTTLVGHGSMPAVLRPVLARMTGPELFAVMTSGMSAVAAAMLAGYAGLGVPIEYLLAASVMSIPGGLLFAKLLCPSEGGTDLAAEDLRFDTHEPVNVIEAAGSGTMVGLQIAVQVGAMLLAFVGLIALLNGIVGAVGSLAGIDGLSMEGLLGQAFAPLAWLIGVPWTDATLAGNFLGQKLILNEFVAFTSLSPWLQAPEAVAAAGLQALEPRTLAILSFALCGFANLASIGLLTGAFGAMIPERRGEVARYGLRTVLAGTLANLMSATIAGVFITP